MNSYSYENWWKFLKNEKYFSRTTCSCIAIKFKEHCSKQLQLRFIVITLKYEFDFNRQHGCIFIDFTFLPLSIIAYFSRVQFLIKKSISYIFKGFSGEVRKYNISLSKCFNITLLGANNAMTSDLIRSIDNSRLSLSNRAEILLITKYQNTTVDTHNVQVLKINNSGGRSSVNYS